MVGPVDGFCFVLFSCGFYLFFPAVLLWLGQLMDFLFALLFFCGFYLFFSVVLLWFFWKVFILIPQLYFLCSVDSLWSSYPW